MKNIAGLLKRLIIEYLKAMILFFSIGIYGYFIFILYFMNTNYILGINSVLLGIAILVKFSIINLSEDNKSYYIHFVITNLGVAFSLTLIQYLFPAVYIFTQDFLVQLLNELFKLL